MMGMNKRAMGTFYENMAAEYLTKRGYVVIVRNYRCRIGEIDMICRDGDFLVFVEVKYRSGRKQGGALMAVTRQKQHVISRVAAYYLMEKGLGENTACRFDVVGIEGETVTLIQNAFLSC